MRGGFSRLQRAVHNRMMMCMFVKGLPCRIHRLILRLSPIKRIHLVQELWDSIHDDAQAMPLTAEQRAELDRGHAELDSGEGQGISLDELRQSLLTRR